MTTTATREHSVETRPAPSARSQKLWAVLLVLDSFFVIIFGGALAAKIYQHWQAPAAPAAARTRRPAKPAAARAEAKPQPQPAAPAPAPAAKPAEPAAGPRPPKPSMIQDAPAHQAAQPQGGSRAVSAAAPAKVKALPTDFAIKAPGARSVDLAGAFIVHGGKKAMVGHPDGTWTVTVYLTPNTYRYWFIVNGRHTLDPRNSRTDRNASVVTVGQ